MLRRLVLRDFRNFEKLDVEFPSAGLVIVGENGHGKTNLLEAISYLGMFRSVRGSRDADVVRFGAAAFHVRAELDGGAHVSENVSVGYERSTKRKKAMVYGVEQSKLSTALGALPSVCFSPVDVALVSGGPAERRHFLDVALALTDPPYLQALQLYRSALKQRNAALRLAQRAGARVGSSHEAQVSVWEPTLSQHGATLVALRRIWCDAHADQFSKLCASIGERMPVSMRYAGSEVAATDLPPHETEGDSSENARVNATALARVYRNHYAASFDQQRGTELRRGVTLVGPHRDDLQLLLGHRDLRTFGSAGQQRTAAIALRMLELATRRNSLGEPPLLLLDDPFAELDSMRSQRILALLNEVGVGQVILTVPRDEDIPQAFTRLERRSMISGRLQ